MGRYIKRNLFTTLQARYWLAGFAAGEFDEWLVRHEFADMLFNTSDGIEWWKRVRHVWNRHGVSAIQIRFSLILDQALSEREEKKSTVDELIMDEPGQPR